MAASSYSCCSSCPYVILVCLNFSLFVLSAVSLAPTIIIKSPPTSVGWALVMVSSISIFSSFLGFYSRLTHFCFVTHVTLLFTSLTAQFLAVLTLYTKEKSTLSLLKSPRDPREAMALVRLECGVFIVMFVMQICVLCLSYGANWGRVTEYEQEMKTSRVAEEPINAKELENMKIDIQV
ncbi:hypothetical protein Tco_0910007 [Tanacetum coccineum]|uniref:Uncharacterized protein n=1 Tax=Tanacetum coccineum TaxID=301880 RepID=A0ABQ5CUE8_9ASTR